MSRLRCTVVAAASFGLFWALGPGQSARAAVPQGIDVTVDALKTGQPLSKYQFGMFIEHIGPLVYRSLWSEMLDDRKFYFPITSAVRATPGTEVMGPGHMELRAWHPVGPDSSVTMDPNQPFVGDKSPRIELSPSTPHGIEQSGLTLVKGKRYEGYVWLHGKPGSRAEVALVDSDNGGDRQTAKFDQLTGTYKRYTFSFTAHANSKAASFAITGTGTGDLHIGAVSLMPQDNVDGFRPDTIALLRQLHSGMWRLPGGNFLSDWSWYNGVGPRDHRPPTFDYAWNAMQSNDVGMDEFMTLCRLIDVEPYVTVNAGFGDAHSAAEEVEYMNGSVKTRLGAERAANGHPAPYGVKYWDIGNEPYGKWQLGRTDLKYYVLKHNEFAKAMRAADPSIVLLASGNMPEPMDLTGEMRAQDVDNMKAVEGTPEDWTGGEIEHSWGNFSGITQHWYAQAGQHFDVQKAKHLPLDAPTDNGYVKVNQRPLQYARYPANIVQLQVQAWQRYQERFPEMVSKKIFLSLDEYAYFGGSPMRGADLKLALAYGMVFNEMLRHTDFLRMSAHTMGVSTMDYSATSAVLNSTGLAFELYGDHFVPGSIPVELTGNSPQPAPQYPIGGDQPRINSGSPTYPLDMFAALSPDRRYLNIAVVNATQTEQKFDLHVTGLQAGGASTLWQMTGDSLAAANHIGQPSQVEIKKIVLASSPLNIPVAPRSINIYRIPVAR